MQKVYFISGLGADERLFQYLNLEGIEPVFIPWIEPLFEEKIEDYAQRMTTFITTPNPIIVGVSFGGMMTVEIAKRIDYQQIILISSAKNRLDLPWHYRLSGRLNLHKIMPVHFFKSIKFLRYFAFNVKQDFEKKLLDDMADITSLNFQNWAINVITKWQFEKILPRLTHIHGTADKVLPNYKSADILIDNGGHFMVVNEAERVIFELRKLIFEGKYRK
jgi:pimeloyl-ACP methyl ester carboxylesterase